jgi:hypothetical protein
VDSEVDTKSKDKITPTTWSGDTGASCHLTNSDDGMFDVQVIKSQDWKQKDYERNKNWKEALDRHAERWVNARCRADGYKVCARALGKPILYRQSTAKWAQHWQQRNKNPYGEGQYEVDF